MRDIVERLLGGYESGSVSRRDLVLALAGLALGTSSSAAQTGAATPTSAAPLQPQGLNHVSLFVSDMNRSVQFYQRVFEMPVQSVQQNGTNLAAGDGTQFLGIYQVPGTPRIDHVCLSVRDFDSDRVMATLRENGVEGRVRMRGEVPEVYFTDPDGLSIQVQDPAYCGGGGPLGGQC
jgi:catechol 2,3-dioxygenase-like lactoylglutathione lyase family enzyme